MNDLGNRGVTAPGLRREDSPSGADRKPAGKREKETGADVSQKLLLTWLIEVPALYGQLKDYLSPEDFTGDPYSTSCADAVCTAGKGRTESGPDHQQL